MQIIEKGLEGREFKLEMIMKGSEHGFSANIFHELCDDKGPTLFVVESEHGKIFGGFTSVSWNSLNAKYFADPTSFIFSISNKTIHR